jgi:hypothetical protein
MGPIAIAMLAGAGLGALKSQEEKNIWADQQKAEAEKTRYAPWTGQWGQNLPGPTGDMGNVMAGSLAFGDFAQKGGYGKDSAKSDNSQTSLTVTPAEQGVGDTRLDENYYKRQRRYMDDGVLIG